MKLFVSHIFLTTRFFVAAGIIIATMAASFAFYWLYPVAWAFFMLLVMMTIADIIILFDKNLFLKAERSMPHILSLGDENPVKYFIQNSNFIDIQVKMFDELPYQLQERRFERKFQLKKDGEIEFTRLITPNSRGKYKFGGILFFINSPIGLIEKKVKIQLDADVPVFPSIIQMKKYELNAHSLLSNFEGIKKHRRIGHSYEFEQIKEYVIGDDSRSINWKASSRKGILMVNHYEDERAQQVYSIIDKSRSMHMPFNNLTLLDYAINTSLVLSNIVLQKHDKAGLITFSDKIGSIIHAEKTSQQLKRIIDALYNEQEHLLEANYELLFHLVRNIIKQRSLILLYTNFESYNAFERVLPILRQINKIHLLVVVFFENEEVMQLGKKQAENLKEIYIQMSARKYLDEKRQIVSGLTNHGIMSIKTLPGDLSMNTINKYLELKSRGLI